MYFITTFKLGKRETDYGWAVMSTDKTEFHVDFQTYIERSRCVGYFNSYEEAEDVVRGNYGDLYEQGYYDYVVIENIPEGLYQYDLEPVFFKWDSEVFKKCNRPEGLENICGLSLG